MTVVNDLLKIEHEATRKCQILFKEFTYALLQSNNEPEKKKFKKDTASQFVHIKEQLAIMAI